MEDRLGVARGGSRGRLWPERDSTRDFAGIMEMFWILTGVGLQESMHVIIFIELYSKKSQLKKKKKTGER